MLPSTAEINYNLYPQTSYHRVELYRRQTKKTTIYEIHQQSLRYLYLRQYCDTVPEDLDVSLDDLERRVLKYMLSQVDHLHLHQHLLDPLQFAYVTKPSVGNATLSVLNVILGHIERRGSYARILFVDFSSAFNTIQPHLMIRKLIDLGVGKHFVMLVHSFLTNRLHYVNVSVVCVRNMCLSPPELLRGVYCRHFCIPCTLIHAEVHTQTITTSIMQTTLLLSVCCMTTKLITEVT